ncbi:YopX family protein [Sphingobacterium thalpophilum]|uniref:YopX family protein n=1 Tax=Sphingobacterium thalpophilum TaxID=259 RepID=UPI0024A752EE|nr:YopX family protein [Sphingobacterium thalpophilum]
MNKVKKPPVRQAKYRGFTIDTKKWVYGVPYFLNIEEDEPEDCVYKACIITGADWDGTCGFMSPDNNCFIEVIPETVGQFTGNLTKAGTEIYDGDKLQQSKDCYWVVKWSDSKCGWNCYQHVFSQDEDGEYSWKKSDTYPLGHSLNGLLTYNYEVIGNIHEESEVTNG